MGPFCEILIVHALGDRCMFQHALQTGLCGLIFLSRLVSVIVLIDGGGKV